MEESRSAITVEGSGRLCKVQMVSELRIVAAGHFIIRGREKRKPVFLWHIRSRHALLPVLVSHQRSPYSAFTAAFHFYGFAYKVSGAPRCHSIQNSNVIQPIALYAASIPCMPVVFQPARRVYNCRSKSLDGAQG